MSIAAGVGVGWAAAGEGVAAPGARDARAILRSAGAGLLAKYRVPGMVVTVVRGRRVGWTECFGVKRAGGAENIEPGTVFEAASLSKPVMAYLAMREVAAGRLDLDRPLARYLAAPYAALTGDARAGRITARQVLSHTSGLPNRAHGKPLAMLGEQAEPGARWSYSGEGYLYLQRVLEAIGGRTLDEMARRGVLGPLGMTESSFVWRPEYERLAATPHDRAGKPFETYRPRTADGAASLHSTAPELARFLAAMLDPAAHRELLPPAAVGAMLVPQVEVDRGLGLSWGLGWGLETWRDSRAFFHWGSNDGFRDLVLGDPATGDGLVVMTNGAAGLDMIEEVVGIVEGRSHPLFRFPMLHPND